MPITSTILSVAAHRPEQTAIAGRDGKLTYAELVEDSRRLFAAVESLHLAQPDPPQPAPETRGVPITAVSIDSAFHTARIIAGLAGYRAVSATIDPRWPLAHRLRVIFTTGIGVIISDSEELAQALAERDWGGTILSSDALTRLTADVSPAPPPTVRDGEEAFLLLFSSGTTSDPKAFLKTRQQYRENVGVSSAYLEPLPEVATLAPGPVSYSLTLYAIIECLATGGAVHVADAFDPIEMGRRVEADHITRVVAVPALVQALSDAATRDRERFASLDLVVTGGANLSAKLRDGLTRVLPEVRLISYYGAAEIGFIGDSRGGDGTRISVYESISVEIRDAHGSPVADGEYGTLWVRAAACSDGYLAGTTDEQLRGPDGWATVHDQGRIIDGQLQLLGRSSDIAVTGGHKVALTEVERAFAGMPGLGEVCAVALPHPRLGSVVALLIEAAARPGTQPVAEAALAAELPGSAPLRATNQGPANRHAAALLQTNPPPTSSLSEKPPLPVRPLPSKEALRAWARARLAPQFVPRQWFAVERLPRTVGGKIRRQEATELAGSGTEGVVRL